MNTFIEKTVHVLLNSLRKSRSVHMQWLQWIITYLFLVVLLMKCYKQNALKRSKIGTKSFKKCAAHQRMPSPSRENTALYNTNVTFDLQKPLFNNSTIDHEWIQPWIMDAHTLYHQPKPFFLSVASNNKIVCLFNKWIILCPLPKL